MSPGTKVRLTGKFLKNTGQQRGDEGVREFTVVECGCASCKLAGDGGTVAVDERRGTYDLPGYYTDAEKAAHPELVHRHILRVNLQPKDADGRWVQRARFEP